MNFSLPNLNELTFSLVDFRPFNSNETLTSRGETPDCSDRLELSSNVYQDVEAAPGTTPAGNLKYEYYDLIFDLLRMDSLTFKLQHFPVLTGSH